MLKQIKLFIVLAFAAMTIGANATVITVDNKPNSAANYSDLQTAIDAALAGDTLYVAGSPTHYGNSTINKQLTIIGAGYGPNNQWDLATIVGSIHFQEQLDEFNNSKGDATGAYISGLYLADADVSIDNGTNIIIERCFFRNIGFHSSTSLVIRNCNFERLSPGAAQTDVIVQNSIIRGGISSNNSLSNITFDHCLFIHTNIGPFSYITISNSIVYGISTEGVTFTSFYNNISFGGASTEFIYGSNTGEGNLPNTNPLFDYANSDFRLQAGSPGIGTATDGTDIGLHGGNFPFPSGGEGYLYSPTPRIPQIYEMNILNSSVPENGTLNVNIKARKSN